MEVTEGLKQLLIQSLDFHNTLKYLNLYICMARSFKAPPEVHRELVQQYPLFMAYMPYILINIQNYLLNMLYLKMQ